MNFLFSNRSRSRYTSRDLRRSNADEGDYLNPPKRLLGWTDKLMHGLTIATSFGPALGAPQPAPAFLLPPSRSQ